MAYSTIGRQATLVENLSFAPTNPGISKSLKLLLLSITLTIFHSHWLFIVRKFE